MDYSSFQRARHLAASQHDVISTQQALAGGLLLDDIRALVRRGQWRRLLAGTYLLDADVRPVPWIAWLQAALLVYGNRACLVGTTAAEVHELAGLPLSDRIIQLAVVPGTSLRHRRATANPRATRRPAHGSPTVTVRQCFVSPTEVMTVDGLRLTTLQRTLADAALDLPRTHALCLLDSALSSGKATADDLVGIGAECAGRPGVRRLRELLPLADGRAQSPLETRIRLLCIDAGMPPDDLQYPVRDKWGHLLGLGDLAWWRGRARPLVVEADGVEPHSLPAALFRDRHRANDFALADVDLIRFTWADTRRQVYIPRTVRSALDRSAA
jgi:hypothetical protein